MAEPKKCTCGKTKDPTGNCDGSHSVKTNGATREIPYAQITIRTISTEAENKTKMVLPHIATNKGLMRNMKFVVSDPQFDAKMEAFKAKKPFIETKKQTA